VRFVALLAGVIIVVLGGWVAVNALDDPGRADEALREAGVTTTEPVVSEALAGTVPSAVCATEEQSVETAVALYSTSAGVAPISINDLVAEGLLDERPTYFELHPDTGEVVAIAGAGCD
jgi:hypothetical protein